MYKGYENFEDYRIIQVLSFENHKILGYVKSITKSAKTGTYQEKISFELTQIKEEAIRYTDKEIDEDITLIETSRDNRGFDLFDYPYCRSEEEYK